MGARVNGQQGEILESVTYYPGLQGGTDLEPATKTISAVAEPALADYTTVHTIPAPTDARLVVSRVAVRLSVTIDSFAGGGAVLNYRVKRAGTSVSTGTLSTAASTGNKLVSFDVTADMTGAVTNTLFLWVDVGTCIISEVTMWSGVGSMQPSASAACLSFGPVSGLLEARGIVTRLGTGNFYFGMGPETPQDNRSTSFYLNSPTSYLGFGYTTIAPATTPHLYANQKWYLTLLAPTVATDLPYYSAGMLILRRYVL